MFSPRRTAMPPELDRYERFYARRAYLGKEQTKPVRDRVRSAREAAQSATAVAFGSNRSPL